MHIETIVVTEGTVYLQRPLPVGSKIGITDISYSLDEKPELYNLIIRAYPAEGKMKSEEFNFILPIGGYTFDSFKTKLFEECKLIQPLTRRFTAYRIIKRITMSGNKLTFRKERKLVWRKFQSSKLIFKKDSSKFTFRKTSGFLKLEMSTSLAIALGSPAKNITITPQGQLTLSRFRQGCNPQTPFTFIHFRPKKTVSIKCQEVDLKNQLDNVLHSFSIKMYKGFRTYSQKQHLFFSKLTPSVHHKLTFRWDSILKVHYMTVLILIP